MTFHDMSLFTYLQSQETAQMYLRQHYDEQGIEHAKAKSYANCNKWLYYLDHGQQLLNIGATSPRVMQPMLLFYGLTHLLKACLLTKRPDYPETTAILAHGVSARKKKRQHYRFIDDEVKIQQNGLFTYACQHLYNCRSTSFRQLRMDRLLTLIPEMDTIFSVSNHTKLIKVGTIDSQQLTLPKTLLDAYHLTARSFIERIRQHFPKIKTIDSKGDDWQITLQHPLTQSSGPLFCHHNQAIYFPTDRNAYLTMPEIMIIYLLLYNLSMISRYETEWWGELLTTKPDTDYPYIKHFLDIVPDKVYFLINMELKRQHITNAV